MRDDSRPSGSGSRSVRPGEAGPETTSEPHTGVANPYVIASALRTLEVLRAFTAPPHILGLADVVAKLRLERNQAYRSLKTLEAAGFLRATDDSRFELGSVATELGRSASRTHSITLLEAAAPLMDRLSADTQETVHLFMRAGDTAACVDKRDSTQSVRLVSVIGRSFPLHAGAVPKAILANLPEAERERVLGSVAGLPRYTDKTILDRQRLQALLKQIREQGYAVSDEDFDAAARGVGAAIFGPGNEVVGGISIGGPSYRVDDDALARFAKLVHAAAGEVTRRLASAGAP